MLNILKKVNDKSDTVEPPQKTGLKGSDGVPKHTMDGHQTIQL